MKKNLTVRLNDVERGLLRQIAEQEKGTQPVSLGEMIRRLIIEEARRRVLWNQENKNNG